jgi:hypothetical protein
MQWHEVGRAAGGRAGGTGLIGRDGGGGGVRAGHVGLNGRAGERRGVGWAGRTCKVGRAVQGRSGGRGARGHGGEDARGRNWLGWSVGSLGPGDGPLIHHPR